MLARCRLRGAEKTVLFFLASHREDRRPRDAKPLAKGPGLRLSRAWYGRAGGSSFGGGLTR